MADKSKLVDINANNASLALEKSRHSELLAYNARTADSVLASTQALIKYLEGHTSKTEVVNQLQSIKTPDVEYVVKALNVLDDTLKTHENTDLSGVTALLNGILEQAAQIPKELPTIPEQKVIDHTKQFENLTKAIQAVEKVVKAQKLVAEAPIVNVPETNVKVDAPNLKPLQDAFKDVAKAVNGIVIPEFKTDNKEVEKLLKQSNKILQSILEKPVGGGGGGGSSWTAIGTNGFPAPLNLDADGKLIVSAEIAPTVGSATEAQQDEQTDLLAEIESAVSAIAQAKGIAADLRVTLLGGTTAVTGALTSVTTVTTVTTVGGLTNIGGLPAQSLITSTNNTAVVLSNINNVIV